MTIQQPEGFVEGFPWVALPASGFAPETWEAISLRAEAFPLKRFEPDGAAYLGIDPQSQAWFKVVGTRKFYAQSGDTGLFADLPEEIEEPDWFVVRVPSKYAIALEPTA